MQYLELASRWEFRHIIDAGWAAGATVSLWKCNGEIYFIPKLYEEELLSAIATPMPIPLKDGESCEGFEWVGRARLAVLPNSLGTQFEFEYGALRFEDGTIIDTFGKRLAQALISD